MNSTTAALALLALSAGPGVQRTGSARFQVSARVVAPLRASAPSTAEVRSAEMITQLVNDMPGESPGVHRAGEPVVARVVPTAARRGSAPATLIGVRGGPSRRCADAGACELSLTGVDARTADAQTLVVTFLPDGAPSGIVER